MFCCLLNPFRGRPRLLMEPRVGTAATLASGPDSEQQHFLGLHPQAPPPSSQNPQIMRKNMLNSHFPHLSSSASPTSCETKQSLCNVTKGSRVGDHTPRSSQGQRFHSSMVEHVSCFDKQSVLASGYKQKAKYWTFSFLDYVMTLH